MATEAAAIRELRMLIAEQKRELVEHRTECLQVRRDSTAAMEKMAVGLKGVSDNIDGIQKLPRRIAQTLGALIIAGAALTNILTYITHQDTATKSDVQPVAQAAQKAAQGQVAVIRKLDAISAAQTNSTPVP
jgi:hypothetical protein